MPEIAGPPDRVQGNVRLCYADAGRGCRIVPVTLDQPHDGHNGFEAGDVRQAALAKALAQLGAEGWELIGLGPSNEQRGTPVLFLKRPKP